MGTWEQGTGDAGGRQAPTVHVKKKLQVVVYPGEVGPGSNGSCAGHLYVFGHPEGDFSCEIKAGPWPGNSSKEAGGHTRGETKAGSYTLGPKHHHVTLNWPMSTIPWGADLEKKKDGEVYYTVDGGPWKPITGPKGSMTQANARYYDNTPADKRVNDDGTPWAPRDQFIANYSGLYYSYGDTENGILQNLMPGWSPGQLMPKWYQNDFGKWSWNLVASAFYIHTTPPDEWAWMQGNDTTLANSHGCIHVHPKDREQLEKYLKKGMPVVVKKYGDVGPNGPPS